MRIKCTFLLFLLVVPLLAVRTGLAQQPPGLNAADRQRFEQVKAKHDRGEALTPEEQAFAQSILQRSNQAEAAKRAEAYAKEHQPRESTGLIPLTELGARTYKGEQGGLYPGGQNAPPPAHSRTGEALARRVIPLNADGAPSSDGKIVL